MYALPERCPFTGLFIPNPIYSTKPPALQIIRRRNLIRYFQIFT
ncbi:hypothetical protein [Serratia symbiotica]